MFLYLWPESQVTSIYTAKHLCYFGIILQIFHKPPSLVQKVVSIKSKELPPYQLAKYLVQEPSNSTYFKLPWHANYL